MKKILRGMLALSLLSFVSMAFSQKIPIGDIHLCQYGQKWSEEQGECVSDTDEHGCLSYQQWDEAQGKCVISSVVNSCLKCAKGSHCENGECVPDTPTEPEEPEVDEPVNLPALEHFTLEESSVTEDEIYLVFAPKGTSRFFLHVYLYNDAGRDILETYCTGDESLCKAVGNGADCADEAPTGSNSWCYAGAD